MHKFFCTLFFTSALILTTAGCVGTSNTTNQTTNQNNQVNSYQLNESNNYLAKPTGQYGVGFQDFHFQDNNRCPDVFYKAGINESDFSPTNINHCREIMVRVYYPTNGTPKLGDMMYTPLIQRFVNMATGAPNMQESYINELYTLHSYSTESADIINADKNININPQKLLPVVLFSHGGGSSVQEYENQITNLVSHGYIVVGVNSFFIGSYIALPNGHVVLSDKSNTISNDSLQQTQQKDIEYVFNNLQLLPHPIYNSMNLNQIGLAGHSYGGGAIERVVRNNPNIFKAAIAEDGFYGDDPHGKPVKISGFTIPFMHILSGTIGYAPKQLKFPLSYNLFDNNFVVGLSPNNQILWSGTYPFYTVHAEFSDENTLKNMKGFQILNQDYIDYTGMSIWSTANSDYIVNAINLNMLTFFNYYLKNPNGVIFPNCNPLVNNTVMACGVTTYGPFQNFD